MQNNNNNNKLERRKETRATNQSRTNHSQPTKYMHTHLGDSGFYYHVLVTFSQREINSLP